ncbi:hypothetical protein BP422_06950 [Brevibacillus formosus]|uniref:Uncharacterized protein n=1 Tax=Brevibacillus formosus TaxID=54913 RepID=A0A220MED5_9BACL|nr:hypothetical protein [Brevibacillus formosus]ASJ53312.1 hypothetical protein BP422_06950 [Brevibacillus formosus]
MSQEFTYYDWFLEQNLTSEQESKLNILLYLISDKLTNENITEDYDRKIRQTAPEFVNILDAPEITHELIITTLVANFQLTRESVSQMFEGMRNQGNFAKLAEFMKEYK